MPRDLFPVLDPPSGGLVRLRTRVGADQRRASRLPRWALAATAIAAVIIVPWLHHDEPPVFDLSHASAATKLGLAPMPTAPVVVPTNARAQVSVSPRKSVSDDVIYYWVASTQPSRFSLED